jgi:hypothetical protein
MLLYGILGGVPIKLSKHTNFEFFGMRGQSCSEKDAVIETTRIQKS